MRIVVSRELDDTDTRLVFSPDAKLLACVSHRAVSVFAVATGDLLIAVECFAKVSCIAFAPNALVIGSNDAGVRIVDLTARRTTVLKGQVDEVRDVAISPDGKRVASASLDGTMPRTC